MAEKNYTPVPPNQFKGKQIIFTSDRVLLNAKEDSIMLHAKQVISLSSAGGIHINTPDKFIVNASKIQLGLNATEPLLLGNKTTDILKELLSKLGTLSEALSNMTVHVGDAEYPLTLVNTPAQDLKLTIEQIQSRLEEIKSKQNYTV